MTCIELHNIILLSILFHSPGGRGFPGSGLNSSPRSHTPCPAAALSAITHFGYTESGEVTPVSLALHGEAPE